MPNQPLEEALRRIIREELEAVEERLGSLEKRVTDGFARMEEQFAWTEEQFEWVSQRFDAVDQRLGAVENAVVLLAQNLPGSIPGQDSHVVRKVRTTLGRGAPASGKIAAKGGP